jgi:hypothetical protein
LAQEFIIKSEAIENKINQLLPSQAGFQAGVDFSASTMVMPIVDLTETAEGSQVRQDLQIATSLNRAISFDVQNTTTTVVNTTGYYNVKYTSTIIRTSGADPSNIMQLTDGSTTKAIVVHTMRQGSDALISTTQGEFTFFLAAGDSFVIVSNSLNCIMTGSAVQIADLQGNLTEVS